VYATDSDDEDEDKKRTAGVPNGRSALSGRSSNGPAAGGGGGKVASGTGIGGALPSEDN